MRCNIAFVALALAAFAPAHSDFDSAVKGQVVNNVYENAFFGLTLRLPTPPPESHISGVVNAQAERARVLEVVGTSGEMGRYTLALTIDRRSNYPTLKSVAQYTRSVRHNLEREGLQTVSAEIPLKLAGLDFVRSVLEDSTTPVAHLRALQCTELKGYLLCIDATSEDDKHLTLLLDLESKLKIAPPAK